MNNSEVEQLEKGYTIPYIELKPFVIYTTWYPRQGKYVFTFGQDGYWVEGHTRPCLGQGSFYPGNGFHYFRHATQEEANKLLGLKEYNYEIY